MRIQSGQARQHYQPGCALDQATDRRTVGAPLEQIAFPVARDTSALDLRRAQPNRGAVGDLAAPLAAAVAGPAPLAVLAQAGDEQTAQSTSRNDVDRGVDRLVGNAPAH